MYHRPRRAASLVIVLILARLEDYSATQAQELIAARQGDADFAILDIRTPAEFAQGHIAGGGGDVVYCRVLAWDPRCLSRAWMSCSRLIGLVT
jgi:hypothetical protein